MDPQRQRFSWCEPYWEILSERLSGELSNRSLPLKGVNLPAIHKLIGAKIALGGRIRGPGVPVAFDACATQLQGVLSGNASDQADWGENSVEKQCEGEMGDAPTQWKGDC